MNNLLIHQRLSILINKLNEQNKSINELKLELAVLKRQIEDNLADIRALELGER